MKIQGFDTVEESLIWILVLVLFAFLAGCDARWHIRARKRCPLPKSGPARRTTLANEFETCVPSQSWDQENLKKHDNTCDTIVYYVDPVTKLLEQCP